tara:strand:+ start:410 stop:877 length:468 start_codon:yes stop_codon:yes gene_type:complete
MAVKATYSKCLVRDVEEGDDLDLYRELRVDDMLEIIGLDQHPWTAVSFSAKISDKAYTIATHDDRMVGMFGVSSTHVPAVGCIWMLGTDRVRPIRLDFVKNCKYWVGELMGDHRCLINKVSTSNKISMRWLKWLGAEFLREQPKGYFEFMIPKID